VKNQSSPWFPNRVSTAVEHRRGVELRQATGAVAELVGPGGVVVRRRPFGQDLQQGSDIVVVGGRAADEQIVI
jgi:hypothetical protein